MSAMILFETFLNAKWQFFLPFCIIKTVKPTFHIPTAWERYPFWVEPFRKVHYRKYPREQSAVINILK